MDLSNQDNLELAQWENEGGALVPETEKRETPEQSKSGPYSYAELILLLVAVAIAHLLPFTGAFGSGPFTGNSCHTIAALFGVLSAYMLTARVLFRDNHVIWQRLGDRGRIQRVWMIQAIGAAVVLAWLAPLYASMHGAAEASIAALGVMISILISGLVGLREHSRSSLHQDLAAVLVIGFAFAWCYTLPHFSGTEHGTDFLSTVTIGSSSLHSWKTVLQTTLKRRS